MRIQAVQKNGTYLVVCLVICVVSGFWCESTTYMREGKAMGAIQKTKRRENVGVAQGGEIAGVKINDCPSNSTDAVLINHAECNIMVLLIYIFYFVFSLGQGEQVGVWPLVFVKLKTYLLILT